MKGTKRTKLIKDEQAIETLNTPGGLLVRLMYKVMEKYKISPVELVERTNRWAIRMNGGVSNTTSQSNRTNALSAFSKQEISINVFFKFLQVLDLDEADFALTLKSKDGEIFVHDNIEYKPKEILTVKAKAPDGSKAKLKIAKPSKQE